MVKGLTEGFGKFWGQYKISSRTAHLGVRRGRGAENQMSLSAAFLLLASDFVAWNCTSRTHIGRRLRSQI